MKKVKVIIFCIIAVLFAFLYAHVDVMDVIYDKNVDNSKYIGTGLIKEGTIEQEFVATEEQLDGIKFKCAVEGNLADVSLVYEVTDLSSGKVMEQGTREVEKAKKSKFFTVPFDSLETSKGKQYLVSLGLTGGTSNDGIGFYYQPGVEENTKLRIQNQEVDGTAILKAYTHRFDLEAFVVVLFFIAFITVFIKILYRFFR